MKIKVNWRHGEYSEDQKHNQKKYLEWPKVTQKENL